MACTKRLPDSLSTSSGSGAANLRRVACAHCPPRPLRARGAALPRATAAEADTLSEEKRDIQHMLSKPYKYGFKTIIESDVFPKGLSEDVVRAISAKKSEPEWLLEFR
jgi:hypothetical protein